ILAVACFLLALLSKETAVILPVVFLLYDIVFGKEKNKKAYSVYGGIILAGIIGVMFFTEKLGFFMPAMGGMDEFLEKNRLFRDISYSRIILMQPRIFITYIAHLLIPVNLNLDYYLQVNRPVVYELVFFLLTGLYFYLMYYFRKNRYILFGLIFFLINYLPISNIIPVLNLVSDRYLFFPSIALFFVMYPLYKRFKLSRYIFIVYAVFLFIVTMSLIPKYRSELALWSYVTEKNPMSAIGHNNLALHYLSNNNMSSAQRHLEKAYSIDSTYAESGVNLAVVYARQGRTQRAIDMLEGIVREQDYHIKALYNLSLLYVRAGQFAEAEKTLKRIIEVSPTSQQPYNNLGTLYFRRGLELEAMISPSIAIFCYPLTGLIMDLTMENYMLADSVFGEGDAEKMSKIKRNREIVKKKLMESR
ncbi:MAG: tetratricopeptide repeat protein, partial [candidate division WOR-3 bacterium]|nr:tetratricopeptide repeat protein [candidate division WOR-3 bacterium]